MNSGDAQLIRTSSWPRKILLQCCRFIRFFRTFAAGKFVKMKKKLQWNDRNTARLQKNLRPDAEFMAGNLAVSEICVNTHTHSRGSSLIISNRARKIPTFFQACKGNRRVSPVGCFCIPTAHTLSGQKGGRP